MKITVGHIFIFLLLAGAGFYFYTRSINPDPAPTPSSSSGITKEISSLVGLFKSGEAEKKSDLPTPLTQESTSTVSTTPAVETYSPPMASVPVEQSAPVPEIPQKIETPKKYGQLKLSREGQESPAPAVVKKRYRKHGSPKKKTKRVVPTTPVTTTSSKKAPVSVAPKSTPASVTPSAPPPAPAPKSKGLVGSFVVLELKSGKKIQGILEQQTATAYQLQLPGMGPFTYPVENVKSIQAAQ